MNLLTDPLFRVLTPDGPARLDLPGLLEALGADRVESLPGLQRHQQDAFHIFHCYLAGAVLAREGQVDPSQSADFWRDGIRRLTAADGCDDDSAWTLVVPDPTRPGFMQARLPSHNVFVDQLRNVKARRPDDLDLLVTAKNHDVKMAKVFASDLEAWTYALINLQTMTCYLGSGQYGVARSSGGTGPRVRVGLLYSLRVGAQWQRDLRRLLSYRGDLLAGPWHYQPDGHVMTWVLEWDLKSTLPLDVLDPFFIEISRGLRLVHTSDGALEARSAKSEPRVVRKQVRDTLKGRLGDPWTPIDLEKETALNVRGEGFTPERLRDLIFLDSNGKAVYEPALMQSIDNSTDADCHFFASALARRGKDSNTDGLQSALVRIPAKVARMFGRGPERDRLAALSKTAIGDSGTMQNSVLKPAVSCLLEGAMPRKPGQVSRREVSAWWDSAQREFAAAWSADFFPWLWRSAEAPDDEAARLDWLRALRAKAEATLQHAIASYPAREGRHYRAQVRTEGLFRGLLFKQFPVLKETQETDHDHARNG
jgi:CRISPR system Cascade subunit CasA